VWSDRENSHPRRKTGADVAGDTQLDARCVVAKSVRARLQHERY
jgi:hypothetical protein